MKITSKNLKTRKKQLVTLACKIAHARDKACRFCGRTDGQMHASHIIPRSRGWRYAVDTANILKKCSRCHRQWHEHPTEGTAKLRDACPDVARYTDGLRYESTPVTVAEAKEVAEKLQAKADMYGVDA